MDASVDDVREFVAESREDAIAKAAGYFRVPPEQLDHLGGSCHGYGIWAWVRTCCLIAALKSARSAPREERRPERRPDARPERRDERGGRPERAARPERTERPERNDRAER